MEVTDISRLATYLRDNGDQILNNATKLTLTAPLLHKLNEAFHLIVENDDQSNPSSFQVINTNNSKFEIFHDLAFLHDFIQKTLTLKITNASSWSTTVNKDAVDISKFGLLRSLELNRVPVKMVSGIQCVRHQLCTLICNHCLSNLEEVLKLCGSDCSSGLVWNELHKAVFSYNALESLDHSIDYIPFVQTLDLSHNLLTNVDPIIFLPNLKCLQLSYNLLQAVPTFSKSASQKLHLLVLKCNHIEDISGLSSLDSLQYLDLSCNCLLDHESSLRPLLKLRSLTWLSLDGNPLSFHKNHRLRSSQCLHQDAANSKFLLDLEPLSKAERLTAGTLSSVAASHTSAANPPDLSASCSASNISVVSSHSQRRTGKVREAFIADDSQECQAELSASFISSSLETSTEHLETKKQIEILRERFGEENWLRSRGGSYVQDILGLPSFVLPPSSPTKADLEPSAAEISTNEKTESEPAPEMVTSSDSIFGSKQQSLEILESDTDDSIDTDDEVEGHVYPVQRILSGNQAGDEMFLVFTNTHIKERDISFGKVREVWPIESLTSCVKLSYDPLVVQLTFDTVRRDRQERRYAMEKDEAQELLSNTGRLLERRTLSAMHQKAFRCLQCSTEFSLECSPWVTVGPRQICPSCDSCLIIEIDEHKPVPLARSPSQSSIGAAASSCAHLEDSQASSTKIASRSGTSLEHSPVRRSDSDIEVISNPSQSSIEVLEERIPEPQLLAAITESSSSGSMTDSVCTSYEQRATRQETVDSGKGCSVKDSESSTETIEDTKQPSANFTSVIEGLLQTVSSKLVHSEGSSELGSRVQYNYMDYAQVDHRVKLHVYQHVFTHEQEQLTMLVRSHVVHESTCVPSCVVVSTDHVYFLHVTGAERDDPDKWLQQFASVPLHRLLAVFALPWSQGVGLRFKTESAPSDFLLLLQDKRRTEQLHTFIAGIKLPCKYVPMCQPAPAVKQLLQSLTLEDKTLTCSHLTLFNSCSVASQTVTESPSIGALIVTRADLILTHDSLLWLCVDSDARAQALRTQKMSNLIEVELALRCLKLHFLDETITESDETWIINLESELELKDVIASIQEPWEELFGIPLQITRKV